jgi:uncharacterized protein YjiS (DUF1127 family)
MNLALYDVPADRRTPQAALPARSGGLGAAIARTIRVWRARIRERREAMELSDRDLRDLGLTRWEVGYERTKPFWRE